MAAWRNLKVAKSQRALRNGDGSVISGARPSYQRHQRKKSNQRKTRGGWRRNI